MLTPEQWINVIAMASGMLVGLCGAYLMVIKDISYLKGALSHVIKATDQFIKDREEHAKLTVQFKTFEERLLTLEERTLS